MIKSFSDKMKVRKGFKEIPEKDEKLSSYVIPAELDEVDIVDVTVGIPDSEDPELADPKDIQADKIKMLEEDIDLMDRFLKPITQDEIDKIVEEYVPDIITSYLIHEKDKEEFAYRFTFDLAEAITIKIKPELWTSKCHVFNKVVDYCFKRQIEYYFVFEHEDSNLHIHGLFIFPTGKAIKNFQTWCNKYIGKFYCSKKNKSLLDGEKWYDYIHKDKKGGGIYMF